MNRLDVLNSRIVSCKECPRLVEYINEVARKKVRRYKDEIYWGRPLTGFGDPNARLLIIGLAPAAHGGNRTGRMFTGDSSGDWLIKALYLNGFANKDTSISRYDNLSLKDAYITAVVRCAPPKNKPRREEIENCLKYLEEELRILKNVKIIVTLGLIAFKTYTSLHNLQLEFYHNAIYKIDNKFLIASYHPSRQNTQTKRLSWDDWLKIFNKARELLEW